MTKATTEASRRAKIISWGVGVAVFATAALILVFMPAPEQGSLKLPEKGRRPPPKRRDPNADKRDRPMPPEHAKQLVKQAEVLIKKELHKRLRKFEQIAEDVRESEDRLLDRIEGREIPPEASADLNDTSMARNNPPHDYPPLGGDPSVKELYERLGRLESEVQHNYLDAKAADKAWKEGWSFPQALEYVKSQMPTTSMPGFENLIELQSEGKEWNRSEDSNASAGLKIRTTADLNRYRGVLGLASRESGLAESRLESMLGYSKQGRPPPPPPPMAGASEGDGEGNGMEGAAESELDPGPLAYIEARLDKEMVKAQALPGRRFSRDSMRRGWLYINTWYMIGPWDNYGRRDFAVVHPPELAVDFDAVYADGMTGMGIEETESHPIKVEGNPVAMDGTLRWKFMQSESMHNTMPVTVDRGTYYAYTELYFDEPTTMLVAIGTDDSGKVWINGKPKWEDTGSSWYQVDEHLEPIDFQYGWNTVMVRLENGGGAATGFSFLICPADAPIMGGDGD